MPTDEKFQRTVEALAAEDPRYAPAAYGFVREAVTHTTRQQFPDGGGRRRVHITGRQLLEGFRVLALERFGCLAAEVLDDWGIRRTEDVGALVFKLVGSGFLGATEEDSPADFADGYDFAEAFGAPFRPRRGGRPPPDFPPVA